MNELNNTVNIATNQTVDGNENENTSETLKFEKESLNLFFNTEEVYWFVVNDWAYSGVCIKRDRFLADNVILTTSEGVNWSVNVIQVFKTKEECVQYVRENYGEDYRLGEKELKFGPEYNA